MNKKQCLFSKKKSYNHSALSVSNSERKMNLQDWSSWEKVENRYLSSLEHSFKKTFRQVLLDLEYYAILWEENKKFRKTCARNLPKKSQSWQSHLKWQNLCIGEMEIILPPLQWTNKVMFCWWFFFFTLSVRLLCIHFLEKEFNANLTFRSGNISGNCEGISGRFSVKGTYTTVKPFRYHLNEMQMVLIVSHRFGFFFWVVWCLKSKLAHDLTRYLELNRLISNISSVKMEFQEAFGIPKIGMNNFW